jgi:hypothetical protein
MLSLEETMGTKRDREYGNTADAFDKALGRALSAAMRAPLGSEEERCALGKLDYLRSFAGMFAHLDALEVAQ